MPRYVEPAKVTGRAVFRDVAVVDPKHGQPIPGRDVLIDNGVVVSSQRTGGYFGDAEIIEGEGRFLTPGFNDMHTHVLNNLTDADGTFALMLANGITGFRQMSGSSDLLARRSKGRLPTPLGAPKLHATSGELLTPLNAGNPAAAISVVVEQHAQGADFIKVGSVDPGTFLAALGKAIDLGIPLGGHLPPSLFPADASRKGVGFIEHLGPGIALFGAVSTRRAEIAAITASQPKVRLPKPTVPGIQWLADKALERLVVNPAVLTSKATALTLQIADASYDADLAEVLAMTFVRHTTWQTPTLVRLHTQQFPDSDEHTADPRRDYMRRDELRAWDRSLKHFLKLPTETRDVLAAHWDAQLRLTGEFARLGVPMVTGTDSCGATGVIPGFALHDEFDYLAEAGVSARQILQMTTTEAARSIGKPKAFGRVTPGQPADLVLLDRDPTLDHTALHTIEGVMRGGHWWGRPELDAILARVAATHGAR